MHKSLMASLIAGAFLSLNVHAADLLQVYKDAIMNDAQYASARDSLAAGQEKGPQGLAGLLPVIVASGDNLRWDGDRGRTYNANAYAIILTQPLFNWNNIQLYQQGQLSAAVSEATFAQAQQDLIVRVAQAYFEVLAAQDLIDFVQAQKIAISEQLASAKRNFEVGTATITDTHEAQSRFDLAVAQEIAGINELEVKRYALQQIIGKPPGDIAPLRSGITIATPDPAKIDLWVGYAGKQNFGVLGSQLALEIAQREISRMRGGHMPTVDLVAKRTNLDISDPTQSRGNDGAWNTYGVQWTIPIFAGGGVNSKVREAVALESKARNDLDYVRRSAAQNARQSYLGVTGGLAQVKALEAAEVSSQSALDSNKLGYEVGVRINIDVLNAQQQLYSVRKELAKSRYETIMFGLKLKSAAGVLKEDDLVKVNGLLKH